MRRERLEKKMREEAERAKTENAERERDIALGNPLLNATDFNMKRRWDDDVVFKNQARGTEDKGKKEFVNVSFPQCVSRSLITNLDLLGYAAVRFPQAVYEPVCEVTIRPWSWSLGQWLACRYARLRLASMDRH